MDKMITTLEKIYNSGLKFLKMLTIDETYKLIAEEGKKLVKADYGSIFLVRDGQLKRAYASDPKLYLIEHRKGGFIVKVSKSLRPLIIDSGNLNKIHPRLKELGIKSGIIIPIFNRNKIIGILAFMSRKPDFFNKESIDALKLFGQTASLAIRKAELYEESKLSLEARDLFISMAAHKLRTPVTIINGYTRLLHSKLAGGDKPESRWIPNLSWETVRLGYLINELLEVDRIKIGALKYFFKECSLLEIIQRAMSDLRFMHPEHTIVLDNRLVKKKDLIIADFDKILHIIVNILDNAAKFSSPDKNITLQLKNKSPHIYLTITDRGQGMSKEDLDGIFKKFYKGRAHTIEGMGLGLFLVKNIVQQHRGEISVKSQENKGTTVEIKLLARRYE